MSHDERIINEYLESSESVTTVAGTGAVEAARRLLKANCANHVTVHQAGMVMAQLDMSQRGLRAGIPAECQHPWQCTAIVEILDAVNEGVMPETFKRIKALSFHPGSDCDRCCSHNPREDFFCAPDAYSSQVVTSQVGEPTYGRSSVIPASW